jgi:ribonuclease R
LQYNKSFEKQVRKEQNGAAGGGRKDRREKKSGPILLEGVFQSHVRGFGFVTVEGLDQDLYIPVGKTANAFYGDRVSVRVISGADSAFVQQVEAIEEAARTGAALPVVKTGAAGRPKDGHRTEAEVVSILSHGVTRIVGTYTKEEPNGYITPDNTHIGVDIYVRNENSQGAVTGHKVVAEITDYGSARKNPEARVTEILGHIDDPGVDILSIIRANDLPEGFPDDVRAEVENVPDSVKDRKGREDLRRVVTVTIDGEDTKDIDDAVSLVKKGKCWELGVHIADVSYYVTEGSALDKEALNRGNSIYLVDRVIPMLPHELSNGICSLNEGKDRYALSCIMTIDEKGEVIDHRITESVINSNARLTYTGVHRLLTQDDNTEAEEHLKARHVRFYKQQAARIAAMLKEMEALSLVLTKAKEKRGAIDFEFQESKIVLDEKGHPVDIHPYERNEATELIENFMLAANETVAEHCCWLGLPFVYRSHRAPDPEKIRILSSFMKNLWVGTRQGRKGMKTGRYADAGTGSADRQKVKGGSLSGGHGDVHPKQIQQLLRMIKGTPEEATLSRMTLRSMQQADYTTDCEGHFGLALKYYCHFTSPIRRYADLQIHRIIRENMQAGSMSADRRAHYGSVLPYVAKHVSEMERRADDAERQTDKQKKCEYMADRIGEEYEGVVSGVTAWGMYVELPDTVEGLVPMAAMQDDFYDFDEEQYVLRGKHTGKVYGLGQHVKIKVAAADTVSRNIDFVPAESEQTPDAQHGADRRPADAQHGRNRKAAAGAPHGSRQQAADASHGRNRKQPAEAKHSGNRRASSSRGRNTEKGHGSGKGHQAGSKQ